MGNREIKVSIVGKPNVGKSRLFNRLVERRKAVIDKFSGVTRDIVTAELQIRGKKLKLIDTGGIGLDENIPLNEIVRNKAIQALRESHLVIFTCDISDGITALDKEIAEILRKHSKKVILVVNKCDNEKREQEKLEFYNLGIGEPLPISALHNIGIEKLKNKIYENIKNIDSQEEVVSPSIKISILGRPNVGKSSFLNALLKQDRAIVDEAPGTTRDSLDTILEYKKDKFLLIDTAGMKHKSKIKQKVESYSFKRTKESITRSDVCLVLIDGWVGLVKDDIRIIVEIFQKGKGCILIVNKWDLVEGVTSHLYEEFLVSRMKKVRDIPVMFTCAKNNDNVIEAFLLAKSIYNNYTQRFSTSKLNKVIKQAYKNHPPPEIAGQGRLKIYYVTQVDTGPPCIEVFVNHCENIVDSYTRYLKRRIREEYFLEGVPIKLIYEASHK